MSTCKKKTSIGGQALIEGIMMRGPFVTSMATRMPDGSIDVETWPTNKGNKIHWTRKVPFLRGIFNMVDSLVVGYGCLMKSAEKAGVEEEEPSKFDRWLEQKLGDNMMKVLGGFAVVLGVALAAVLFIFIPTGLSSLLRPVVGTGIVLSLIEGLIKVLILVGYMALCSRMKEIRRVFEYHGAEHKSIACYEAMEPLTVENIRPQCRFHPRCGTSFLFLVILISIIIGSFISWKNALLRAAIKLLLIPVVVGIAYELIKLAGRCDNVLTRVISAPGLWLQRITTCEPDGGQIECAVAALKAVIPEDENADRW
jgi:uncharacterized protein YqhQ